MLTADHQSAQMSKITNYSLTHSGTGCFIVPIWRQWVSKSWGATSKGRVRGRDVKEWGREREIEYSLVLYFIASLTIDCIVAMSVCVGNKSAITLSRAVGRQSFQCWWDSNADLSALSHLRALYTQRLDTSAGVLRAPRRIQSSLSPRGERTRQVGWLAVSMRIMWDFLRMWFRWNSNISATLLSSFEWSVKVAICIEQVSLIWLHAETRRHGEVLVSNSETL